MPKDSEIAAAALNHLFKIKYFKDEDQLNNIFNCPFFSENISDPDYYREKYRTDVSKVDVDFRGLASEEYKNKLIEELKGEIISTYSQEIEEAIYDMHL